MNRQFAFPRLIASLPIRWRLALVSFGLLALLLAALSILISTTEEQTLLASQASVLANEAHLAQLQLQFSKIQLTEQQILTFPEMSESLAISLVSSIQASLGQNVHVSLLLFNGSVPEMQTEKSPDSHNLVLPVVRLPQASVQQWLNTR